jgi:hypothetical protein
MEFVDDIVMTTGGREENSNDEVWFYTQVLAFGVCEE